MHCGQECVLLHSMRVSVSVVWTVTYDRSRAWSKQLRKMGTKALVQSPQHVLASSITHH